LYVVFFGFVSFVSAQRIVDNEEDITMTLWILFPSFFLCLFEEQGKHQPDNGSTASMKIWMAQKCMERKKFLLRFY
jgi:hypothetical protein